MRRQIADFALIGDGQTAALVSRSGAVEWLCWPSFSSEACFAALLGGGDNGRWTLGPEGGGRASARAYRPDTLVLESRVETDGGRLRLVDFMPMGDDASHLIRVVRCEAGRVAISSSLALRFDYGRVAPWLVSAPGRVTAICGPSGAQLASDAELTVEGGDVRAQFTLQAGESRSFCLSYFQSHLAPPEPPEAEAALRRTEAWWRRWVGRHRYEGP